MSKRLCSYQPADGDGDVSSEDGDAGASAMRSDCVDVDEMDLDDVGHVERIQSIHIVFINIFDN